jgi:hypothetical protein
VALALALLLALRLLSPAGFMPEFVDGAVTIVACPDGGPVAAMAGHDHQRSTAKLHQTCPYAAAAALGGLANEPAPLVVLLAVGLALLLGRTHSFIVRQRAHERPPLRGPPIPA